MEWWQQSRAPVDVAPHTAEPHRISIDAVFDIETEEWENFVVGGIRWSDGEYRVFSPRHPHTESDMVDELLSIDGTVWSHAGGMFDMKWLLDHIARRGVRASVASAGARIVSIECGNATFCDSWALFPLKLKDLTAGASVSKDELRLPCRNADKMANGQFTFCGPDCEGYCSIRRDMPDSDFKRVCDYLELDCESLFRALVTMTEYATDNDLDLSRTVGSAAWRNVLRTLKTVGPCPYVDKLKGDMRDFQFARAGYFGGRVECYRYGKQTGHQYDVNSMYPWALSSLSVPVGNPYRVYGRDARNAYGKPGLWKATVTVPESFLPPLPYRFKKKSAESIAYPHGTMTGVWPLIELQHAESRGCHVEPLEGLVWDDSDTVFSDWISRLWKLRMNAPGPTDDLKGKKSPIGVWLKFYMNSLTGKFGSNPIHKRWDINPQSLRFCKCVCALCGKRANAHADDALAHEYESPRVCKCRPHVQVSERVFCYDTEKIDPCAHVEWSAYLTARSRVHLNTFQLHNDNGRDMIYSDTDSAFRLYRADHRDHGHHDMFRDGMGFTTGNELGTWEYAGAFTDSWFHAPKVYWYFTPDAKPSKQLVSRAKGIKLKKGQKPIPGEEYAKEAIRGFTSGTKAGVFFAREEIRRRISGKPNVGEWVGNRILMRDGRTRAPAMEEIDHE